MPSQCSPGPGQGLPPGPRELSDQHPLSELSPVGRRGSRSRASQLSACAPHWVPGTCHEEGAEKAH